MTGSPEGWFLLRQPYVGFVDVDGVRVSSAFWQVFFISSWVCTLSGEVSFVEVVYGAGSSSSFYVDGVEEEVVGKRPRSFLLRGGRGKK